MWCFGIRTYFLVLIQNNPLYCVQGNLARFPRTQYKGSMKIGESLVLSTRDYFVLKLNNKSYVLKHHIVHWLQQRGGTPCKIFSWSQKVKFSLGQPAVHEYCKAKCSSHYLKVNSKIYLVISLHFTSIQLNRLNWAQ